MLDYNLTDLVQPFGYLGFAHWTVSLVLLGVVQKFHHTKSGEKENMLFWNVHKNLNIYLT